MACRDLVAEVGHDGVFDVADPVACIVQGLAEGPWASRGAGSPARPRSTSLSSSLRVCGPQRDCGNTARSSSSSESAGSDSESSDESDSDLEPGTPRVGVCFPARIERPRVADPIQVSSRRGPPASGAGGRARRPRPAALFEDAPRTVGDGT